MPLTFDQALASANPRIGIFFRLGLTPPFRLWLGIGDCQAGIDATDGSSGAIYSGFGQMLNIPAFQQLINGAADRAAFQLAYVSQNVATLASADSDAVKGAVLMIGYGLFDASWQLIGSPQWLRRLIIDYLTVARDHTGGQAIYTLSLAARSYLTGRRRPGLSYWVDRDQQTRHAGDKFCERASLYSVDVIKTWPRFS